MEREAGQVGWEQGAPWSVEGFLPMGMLQRRAWRDTVTETHLHAAAYWGHPRVILTTGTRLLTAWAGNLGFKPIPYL